MLKPFANCYQIDYKMIFMFFMMTPPILWTMQAETADYAEWKFGVRSTAIIFSAATFSQKFALGIGGALAGWLLGAFGYVPGTEQNPLAITGIRFMMGVIPALGGILNACIIRFFEIDDDMYATIRADLAEKRKTASS